MISLKDAIVQFLETEDKMAKAIRQAISEKKLPRLAECLTTSKSDKDETTNNN